MAEKMLFKEAVNEAMREEKRPPTPGRHVVPANAAQRLNTKRLSALVANLLPWAVDDLPVHRLNLVQHTVARASRVIGKRAEASNGDLPAGGVVAVPLLNEEFDSLP